MLAACRRPPGFTDHDRNIAFDGTTFAATSGFTATDIEDAVGTTVDTLDVSSTALRWAGRRRAGGQPLMGDTRCGNDFDDPDLHGTGVVTVLSSLRLFTASGFASFAADWPSLLSPPTLPRRPFVHRCSACSGVKQPPCT